MMEQVNETKNPGHIEGVNRFDINYMHRPPRIIPNYGTKQKSVAPKTSVTRVLLYDNVTQQQMLDVRMSNIKSEKSRSVKILDMNKKSFILRRLKKNKLLRKSMEKWQNLRGELTPAVSRSVSTRNSQKPMTASFQIAEPSEAIVEEPSAEQQASKQPESGATMETKDLKDSQPKNSTDSTDRLNSFNKMSDLKLPDINKSKEISDKSDKDLVTVRVEDKDGQMTEYQALATPEERPASEALPSLSLKGAWFSNGKPLSRGKNRTVRDPRFMELEASLIKINHSAGYLELSPSFQRDYRPMPAHIQDMMRMSAEAERESNSDLFDDEDDEDNVNDSI